MSFARIQSILSAAGAFLSWLFGLIQSKPVKTAYKKVAEAERETAVAKERVTELNQERVSSELRDKELDEILDDEEY